MASSIPTYDELATFIASRFAMLRTPYMEWANLARRAIRGLPYDAGRLDALECFINEHRAELRIAIMLASEHLDETRLVTLRDQAHMSKHAWKTHQKWAQVNLKDGFRLISY